MGRLRPPGITSLSRFPALKGKSKSMSEIVTAVFRLWEWSDEYSRTECNDRQTMADVVRHDPAQQRNRNRPVAGLQRVCAARLVLRFENRARGADPQRGRRRGEKLLRCGS